MPIRPPAARALARELEPNAGTLTIDLIASLIVRAVAEDERETERTPFVEIHQQSCKQCRDLNLCREGAAILEDEI